MRVSDSLILLWIPIGVKLSIDFINFSFLYEILKHLKCMLKSIFEDVCIPIIRSSLISIDDMYKYLHFGLVGVVFDDLNGFSF